MVRPGAGEAVDQPRLPRVVAPHQQDVVDPPVGEQGGEILGRSRGEGRGRPRPPRSAARASPGIDTQPTTARPCQGSLASVEASSRAAAPAPAIATRRSRRRSVRSSSSRQPSRRVKSRITNSTSHRAGELAVGEEPPGDQRHRLEERGAGEPAGQLDPAARARRVVEAEEVERRELQEQHHQPLPGEEAQPVPRQQPARAGDRHVEAEPERDPERGDGGRAVARQAQPPPAGLHGRTLSRLSPARRLIPGYRRPSHPGLQPRPGATVSSPGFLSRAREGAAPP